MNKINFENLPSTNTPINATNLNQLQTNVENAINEFTESTDGNGWTVLDFGKYKEYVKTISKTITVTGNSWSSDHASNLPAGMSTLGNRFLTSAGKSSDNALSVNFFAVSTDTEIIVSYRNIYSGSVTTTIDATFRILELPS